MLECGDTKTLQEVSADEVMRKPMIAVRAISRPERLKVAKPTRISFGGTAAIVTSMALITGLAAANGSRASVIGALLIAAVADNLTDSLSVHIYQESERLEQSEAFLGTVANFATRLVLCLTFLGIVAAAGVEAAAVWSVVWGMVLLSALTYVVARHRQANAITEVAKHLAVAAVVILVSKGLGYLITTHVR